MKERWMIELKKHFTSFNSLTERFIGDFKNLKSIV